MNFSKIVFKLAFTVKMTLLIIFFASTAYAELKIDSVYPTLGLLGQDLEVILKGSDFDGKTRVSMYLDSGNKRKIIGSVDTPDYARGVMVVDTTAYVVDEDSGLQVIDVSIPDSPQIIGSVDTPKSAVGVAVVGITAYVADGDSGLQIIDVSNPASPQIIGSVNMPGYASGVTVVGNKAYVADFYSGLQVIDVSNPVSPQIIGSVDTPGNARDLTVIGTTAYVADSNSGLQVIDVSNPASPQITGSLNTPGYAWGVTVVGTTAYVVDDAYNVNSSLQVIDVSNPASPQIIGSVNTPGYASGLTVVGKTAYVADGSSGLQVIDVSNPASPQIIGSVNTPGVAFRITVVGTTAYVADGDTGLQVIDINTPTSLQVIGSVSTPGRARGVTIVETTAYVADDSGLQVIDVSNPVNPQIIGSIDTPGRARGVTVVGNMAYVVDDEFFAAALKVIDISNPVIPKIIGSVNTPAGASGVAVLGNTAYVVNDSLYDDTGLQVIDISIPASPKLSGFVNTPGLDRGVTVVETTAYVATGSGLQIIDVSNPASPQIIGSLPGNAHGITVAGTTAYAAAFKNGLQVIDVRTPASPKIIGSVDTPGYALNVTVVGTTAYVADGHSGYQAIDVSTPANPQIIGSVNTPVYAYGVAIVGTTAYVADSSSGLVIVPVPKEIRPVSVNNATSISVTLPSPIMAGHYTLRVFNETKSDELAGAVSFTDDLQIFKSKAIIVAGGGPNATGEIWDETKKSANKAYDTLVYEGYDHNSIWYLSMETGNPYVDGPALPYALDEAINTWATNASELVIFFVDHGLPDNFIIYADGDYSQKLNVGVLDGWLDKIQQNMVGPITFIYDACNSGTFASKLVPPAEKDRIIITGASDESADFGEQGSFSFQFWEQIRLKDGNLGHAFKAAADIMQGYQSALINANNNRLTNEDDDFTKANGIIIRRGQPIYLKPAPTIDNVIGDQTLNGSSSATIWVSDVRDVESVWAKIIPPDISPDVDGIPITDLPTIELQDTDHDGTYDGTYHDFTIEGTYTIITNAQTSQEIYSYVQEAMVTQIIPSLPVYTSVTQMNGVHKIKADSYEEDDTYPQANVITLNDLDVQPHNFHDPGDVDWVKFYGLSGKTYTIKAGSVSVICNVVIELFDSSGTTPLVDPWNEAGDGEEEIMEWTCTRDDVYYVRLSNTNATFGENCKYDLKLYRPIAPLVGFVTGIVKNAISKQALGNVQIKTSLNQTTLSHSDGSYLLVHEPVTITVTAKVAGHNTRSYYPVQVNEGDITTIDIDLNPSPTDTDNDGILDGVEYASSCLDANDADSDNDGIVDGQEDKNCNGIYDPGETNPCNQDTDGDQMPDGWEVQYNLNPIVDDASQDADGDGYSNLIENRGGSDPTDQFSLPRIRSLPWIPLLLLED